MKKPSLAVFIVIFFIAILLVTVVDALDISLKPINNSIGVDNQDIFTGASLAADFDGEGVNNDVAVIDQSRCVVFVLIYNQQSLAPTSISTIRVCDMFTTPFIPTSATAFIDARTG